MNDVPAKESAADRRAREAAEKQAAKDAAKAEALRLEAEEVAKVEARNVQLRELPLLQLIAVLNPHFRAPSHLRVWCELIEAAAHNAVRAMCSIPIRHYKTETTVHGIVYLLLRHPDWRVVFFTHSAEAAMKWGKRIRQIAEATEIGPAKGWDTIGEWRNKFGGGVVIMSANQSRIGYDCDALIVDDPLDEMGANDPKTREAVDEAISLYTARCLKSGKRGPVLLVASRFHSDDPIGRRLLRTAVQWDYVHHAAIVDEGAPTERAFAPDVWPLDELRRVRAELAEKDPTERIWWAQFQNDPRPPGSDLFGPVRAYDRVPEEHGYRTAYGADLAFSKSDTADYFCLVAAKIVGDRLFLTEAVRERLGAHMIEATTRRMQSKWGDGPVYTYVSGPEMGFVRLMAERGLNFVPMRARYNKLVRAERTIHRWNHDRILVPNAGAWVPGFKHRVTCWRGVENGGDDDDVDALVSLADGAMGSPSAGLIQTSGRAYAGFWTSTPRPGRA